MPKGKHTWKFCSYCTFHHAERALWLAGNIAYTRRGPILTSHSITENEGLQKFFCHDLLIFKTFHNDFLEQIFALNCKLVVKSLALEISTLQKYFLRSLVIVVDMFKAKHFAGPLLFLFIRPLVYLLFSLKIRSFFTLLSSAACKLMIR